MTHSTVDQLTPTVWRQYFCHGYVVAFRVFDARRTTIDVWIEACAAEMYHCTRDERPLRIVQDLRSPDFAQTPYSKERGAELTSGFAELPGRVAMVVPASPELHRIRHFTRRIADQQTRERDVFTDPLDALQWVVKGVPPYLLTPFPATLWPE